MSSPAQGRPSVATENVKEKKGLRKLVSRMGIVLRRTRKRTGQAGPLTVPEEPVPATLGIVDVPSPAPPEASKPLVEATLVPRTQIFEERAKRLAERYGLELTPSEWHRSLEGNALRVETAIKMRVHRHCHSCRDRSGGPGTPFVPGVRECMACGHTRCRACPRVPPRRNDEEKEAVRHRRAALIKDRAENAPILADWDVGYGLGDLMREAKDRERQKNVSLRRPAKPHAQDLVYKKPRQRVRRTCCQDACGRLFPPNSKACDGCGHARCTDCPREPAKKDKYPYGYPGDEPGTKLGHYECHDCKKVFQLRPATDETECPSCANKSTSRLQPEKVEPEPNPDIWLAVQAKLEALRLA